MTLNIMLTSRTAVFLSGDFRLTYLSGKPPEDDLEAQKLIPVLRRHWSALIAFTGVAKTTTGLDVGDWIESQVSAIGTEDPVDELVDRLKTATVWLGGIVGYKDLAFSVVGFVGRRPFAMVISNFTDLSGRRFPSLSDLVVDRRRPKGPHAFLPGQDPGFLKDERVELEKRLTQRTPPVDVLREMARINAAAAGLAGTISEPCVAGSLLASGTGEILPFAIPEGRQYLPGFVRRQLTQGGVIGFKPKCDASGSPLPPRWVGMTTAVKNQRGQPWAVVPFHVVRNIDDMFYGQPKKGIRTFWRRATSSNEPPVTINLGSSPPTVKRGPEWE